MKWWLLVMWLWSLSGIAEPIVVTDAVGQEIALEQPAQRIVALSPHLVENLFAIGAGDRIVATITYADYPEAARQLPRIGNLQQISVEAIVALQPDLVLAWASGTSATIIKQLQSLGVTVYQDEPKTLDDIAQSLQQLGQLTGQWQQAQAVTTEYLDKLVQLKNTYAQAAPVTVFYQIWHEPLQTLNRNHVINSVIELCGGRNSFANAPVLAPKINIESVLIRNPQVIIASAHRGQRPQWLDQWQQWPSLSAVQQGQLYFIDADLLERHTLRILRGAEQLCECLQQARP